MLFLSATLLMEYPNKQQRLTRCWTAKDRLKPWKLQILINTFSIYGSIKKKIFFKINPCTARFCLALSNDCMLLSKLISVQYLINCNVKSINSTISTNMQYILILPISIYHVWSSFWQNPCQFIIRLILDLCLKNNC